MNPLFKFRELVSEKLKGLDQEGAPPWLIHTIKQRELNLAERFPLTIKCLKDDASSLSLDYWNQFPQIHWNLELACSHFPMFLRERARSWRMPKFLPELAEFEWSLHWVPIDLIDEAREIQKLSAGVYALNPVVKVFRFEHRIYQFYWEMMEEQVGASAVDQAPPENEPEILVISRDLRSFEIKVIEPSLVQAALIDILTENQITKPALILNCQQLLFGSGEEEIKKALVYLVDHHVVLKGL